MHSRLPVCYILFVCTTLVICAGAGNEVKCNASMTCPETFACKHYEGCKFGECVCLEPRYYLNRNKTSCLKKLQTFRCPKGLKRNKYLKVFRKKCYYFEDSETSWYVALERCQKHEGTLVHIRDQATQDFVYSSLLQLKWSRNGVWIGARDYRENNEWEWAVIPFIPVGPYNNWDDGHPSCSSVTICDKTCGLLRTDSGGKWHNERCSSAFATHSYICMYGDTTRVGCAEGSICHKSEVCNKGKCRCKPGYSRPDRSSTSPCIKITVFPKIGERCVIRNERDICEGLTLCSRCPGDDRTTCVGRLIDYEKSAQFIRASNKVAQNLSRHGGLTNRSANPYDNETESVNNTNVTPLFRKKSGGGISPAIYVIIPIALILIGIAICLVVKKKSDSKRKFESVEKPTEPI